MEHQFNVGIASKYGIEEAIIVHNLFFWIKKNAANEKHKHEGRYWTYNSCKAFTDIFPYLSESTIYRVLKSLVDKKIICKGNYNENKYIRTSWYAFTDEGLNVLKEERYDIAGLSDTSLQSKEKHFTKSQNEKNEIVKCNTDSNTDSKHKEEIDKSISKKKEIDFESVVSVWNGIANDVEKISSIRGLTEKRKKQICSLLKTCNSTCDELIRFIKTLPYADDWVIGKGDRKWSIDFDWLIQNTSNWYVAGLEGNMHKRNKHEFDRIMQGADVDVQSDELNIRHDDNNIVINGIEYR